MLKLKMCLWKSAGRFPKAHFEFSYCLYINLIQQKIFTQLDGSMVAELIVGGHGDLVRVSPLNSRDIYCILEILIFAFIPIASFVRIAHFQHF